MSKIVHRSLSDSQITALAAVNHDFQQKKTGRGFFHDLAAYARKSEKNGGILSAYFEDLNEKFTAIHDNSVEGENRRLLAVASIDCLSVTRLKDALSAVSETAPKSKRVQNGMRKVRESLLPNFS